MKLELKHIAPYLPYGLEYGSTEISYKTFEEEFMFRGELSTKGTVHNLNNHLDNDRFKIILRPLSDLTKEIEVNEENFIPCEKLWGSESHLLDDDHYPSKVSESLMDVKTDMCFDYPTWQKLFEWHFDVFGLIDKGLAVDINTLNK